MSIVYIINKLSKVISNREFDNRIRLRYIITLVLSKLVALLWGNIRLKKIGFYFISPYSTIRASFMIKANKKFYIGPNCFIDAIGTEGLELGNNVSIGRNTTIVVSGSLSSLGLGIKIGDNVGLGTNGHFGGAGGLVIGDDTIIGNFVSMHPENHNYSNPDIPIRLQGVNHKGIKIGKGCWIGAKATILDGTTIGDGCIVAAGAVVSGHFPDNVIIGGVPAKIIKSRIS